ncbi:hypothetical protein [Beggiatoa leptomitoformis]|uniref:Uncharacterized protein n=1 Tax=Beggiatoa leptomitoformis TaxID=288004 RepID=A0A2N9YIQ5_9GAMM|nr:hypothetical protein [Beggiatoa leptomitoformis]ALG67405.1 hypothetical protein AL038_06420 [Beggiatoa leptomitoformis]AUI70384.1 hypothetical protein BLE401_17885 [Beggiatoa leptomitoformis]
MDNYKFAYLFSSHAELIEFSALQNLDDFGYFKYNNQIPFFYQDGSLAYASVAEKLAQATTVKQEKLDLFDNLIIEVFLDEALYIKLLPNEHLYRVESLRIVPTPV